ncbi:MAG: FUSC family protein [Mycetocola sp.]
MNVSLPASARLTPRQLLFACALVAVAALVLGTSQFLIGPNTATAGYLTMLFLLSVVRTHSWRIRLTSIAWSVAVALLGYVVGGLGLGVTLVALVVVSVAQGFVTVGESALLNRSPVNLLAFASLSVAGAQVWQVVLGSIIGALVIVTFSVLAQKRDKHTVTPLPMADRVSYGAVTALGAVIIVFVAELLDFPYVAWTLLSFSVIVSVGADQRTSRGMLRVLGSVAGVIIALLVALLPAPVPLIFAIVFMVLCVAYITVGNYALFVLFLTPAILLTTATEYSAFRLGLYRLEAVLFATVIALLCSWLVQVLARRIAARRAAAHGDAQANL